MKSHILFDLDGTLNDTGPGIMGSVQTALGQLGWPPQPESFLRQFVGPPLVESFMTFCRMDEPAADQAIALYRARYHTWGVYQSPLYPGVEAMLASLSKRAVLCVATSKREEGARQILSMRGIEDYFQIVVGDDGTRPTKAHVIGHVLELLGNPLPEQVVMIGDRSYDVAGAKAWGVEAIGALYGYSQPGELEEAGAVWLASSVKELTELCLRLTEKGEEQTL